MDFVWSLQTYNYGFHRDVSSSETFVQGFKKENHVLENFEAKHLQIQTGSPPTGHEVLGSGLGT